MQYKAEEKDAIRKESAYGQLVRKIVFPDMDPKTNLHND